MSTDMSDALVVGENFISEHYFTTDAGTESFRARVLERRKQWDADRAAGESTVRARYTEARAGLASVFAGLAENADQETLDGLYTTVRTILGFDQSLRWDITATGGSDTEPGPVTEFRARELAGDAPFALIEARCVPLEDLLSKHEKTLLREFHTEKEPIGSVAALLSDLFVKDSGPTMALVLAGPLLLVAERERWLEGRYLAVDLQLVGERSDDKRGGEVDRALTCIAADSLAPDAEGNIWWTGVFDESVKHTVGVSKDLREGVRLSIELIANDVIARRRARGLDPLDDELAQPLAQQSLRFLYRILFLLYAEATPDLAVVPAGDPTYERGYSLDRLRELLPVDLVTPGAQAGTHFYDSLHILFELVDGRRPATPQPEDSADGALAEDLQFRPLRADLFRPEATELIDQEKLSNAALQQVLRHLLLSKQVKGRDRGFISYAELGINQLGAVYEGLMSYTGFFAKDTLYEVAKNGNAEKGSWVVPDSRIGGISESDFVRIVDDVTGEPRPVVHRPGTFVFRLAGRERQQSASYYTPEVLTKFTVGQALEELLDQDGTVTPARDILELTVCEPALGSGAFAIEAVRQLAEEYLKRRQAELGERIDPDTYPTELQRTKAYIALHQVYGVDLNATAVEFAEITLWLDTMGRDLDAPWFGLHLRRGNSLIGARRAVIPGKQITDKSWIDATPIDVPLSESLDGYPGAVHHFLVPTSGWGSTVDAKEAKQLAPKANTDLRDWRRSLKRKLTTKQVRDLRELAERVETLWGFASRRLEIAEAEIRRPIAVWGHDTPNPSTGTVSREQIEDSLADPKGAYQRLRTVMDAWCALWFWPLTDADRTVAGDIVEPPSIDEWITTLTKLLGHPIREKRKAFGDQIALTDLTNWADLGTAEDNDRVFAGAKDFDEVADDHPWLHVVRRVAKRQGFFHWELDFAAVFTRGGFDLQVGNPPWVRPDVDVSALLAEGDPWFALATKPTQKQVDQKRGSALSIPWIRELVVGGTSDTVGIAAFLRDPRQYPHLTGLRPDLYRCFMEQVWRHASGRGISALISLESHFTDEKAGALREVTYRHLRRHWHHINELQLFSEVQHQKTFGVCIYGKEQAPRFLSACWLYHPDAVLRSFAYDADGPEPGLKDPAGNWDLRPHSARLTTVDDEVLRSWHHILESEEVPLRHTRMVFAVNRSVASAMIKAAGSPRLGQLGLLFSQGWNETTDRQKGYFESEWGPVSRWDDAILQGPHLFVSTPLYKSPNPTMANHLDWSPTDFEALAPDALPVTSYKPAGSRARYDADYASWEVPGDDGIIRIIRARDCYRVAWRSMAANTGERTLITALIPPGTAHVHAVAAAALPGHPVELSVLVAISSSLIADFMIRVAPKSNIPGSVLATLPLVPDERIRRRLVLRALRLNCVTDAYEELWRVCRLVAIDDDSWVDSGARRGLSPLAVVPEGWSREIPLRRAIDRRQALVEIDALVALGLGLTADELCTIYRTQFPVLYGYDHNRYLYDSNGRLVPQEVLSLWRKKGDALTVEERTATNPSGNTYTYELPFRFLDREADMRQAYAEFERRLAAEGGA